MSGLVGLFFLGAFLFFYFIPVLVARQRGHRNEGAIMVLNFFLGWTLIGWVIALIWANTDNTKTVKN